MHGVWEENGPTNFQAPLHPAASDPAAADHLTVSEGVNTWLKAGMPANKLVLGIPLYWRGWSGVAPGRTHGLYQRATGPSPPYPFTRTAGTADYHELLAAGKLKTVFYDSASGDSPWVYDGNTFYTGETPASIQTKTAFIKSSKLRGAMVFSLAADTATGTLLQAVTTGLR
jgi:chitinase